MFRDLFRTKSLEQLRASAESPEHQLKKNLGAFDLTMFGIGAIIGAGIFSVIGTAAAGNAADGTPAAGPALTVSIMITAIACGFTAVCYAELASMIPISGSAYTYAYATLGELMAWVLGWDLVLEYAVSNVAVAISWGDYARSFFAGFGIHVPPWLAIDPRSALVVDAAYLHGVAQPSISARLALFERARTHAVDGAAVFPHWDALQHAPVVHGLPLCINFLAVLITISITWLCYIGIRESSRANAVMVVLKLAILLAVIVLGARFVSAENYTPFAPNGFRGMQAGAASIFFAFIGFDAVSTTAEECRNPERDLPRGIIGSLVICTVVYVLVAIVVTGMVRYSDLEGKADPLAYVFQRYHMSRLAGVVSLGAVIATAACLLTYQVGQPRILMAMSRDGLLGKWFGRVHPRYGTPSNATLLTGIVVALPAGFMNIDEVVGLVNIGTLFAFAVVCLGVLVLRYKRPNATRKFRVPAVWPVSLLGMAFCAWLAWALPAFTWWRFVIWLVVGLAIYATFGRRRSRLRLEAQASVVAPKQ